MSSEDQKKKPHTSPTTLGVEKSYHHQTENVFVDHLKPKQLAPWEAVMAAPVLMTQSLIENNYCVFDNFIDPSELKELKREVMRYHYDGRMTQGQIGTLGDGSKGSVKNELRSDHVLWFEGNEPFVEKFMKRQILRMDVLAQKINILLEAVHPEECWAGCDRCKIMATVYKSDNEGKYCAHYDNPDRNGRKLTAILYLNDQWKEGEGGVLRMKTQGKTIDVAPLSGRLLLFWSDRRCPHEVLPAKGKDRYAITIWYMDRNERPSSKKKM